MNARPRLCLQTNNPTELGDCIPHGNLETTTKHAWSQTRLWYHSERTPSELLSGTKAQCRTKYSQVHILLIIHAPQSLPIVLAAAMPDAVGSISPCNTFVVIASIDVVVSTSPGGSSSVDASIGIDSSIGVDVN